MISRPAFAIFRNEDEGDSQLSHEISFGRMMNNLSADFSPIDVCRYFTGSLDKNIVLELDDIDSTNIYLFNLWLKDVCHEFVKTNLQHLLIVGSKVSLPDQFQKLVEEAISNIDDDGSLLYVFEPTKNFERVINFQESIPIVKEKDNFLFILNRFGAKKLLLIFEIDMLISFNQIFTILQGRSTNASDLSDIEKRTSKEQTSTNKESNLVESISPDFLEQAASSTAPVASFPPRIQVFISHWQSTWKNIGKIVSSCEALGLDTRVLNTTSSKVEGFINDVPISFFSQLEVACNLFDAENDFLLFITADVQFENWEKFFNYCKQILKFDRTGSLSPNLSYEWFMLHRLTPTYFEKEIPLSFVKINDFIVVFVNKRVIEMLREFFVFFHGHQDAFRPIVGYGLSEIVANIVYHLDLVNIRSREYTLRHYPGTSYSVENAIEERQHIEKIADDFFSSRGMTYFRQSWLPDSRFLDSFVADLKQFMNFIQH